MFETVTIVGVGLLGGSLGLALKERGLAGTIRGVGRRQSSLDQALARGAIDEAHTHVANAAMGADLIVLCGPAASVPEHLDLIRMVCGRSTVVTDVASTKADICAHAKVAWAEPYRFVGSHPMAGSEKFGPEHADAKLFEGSACLVEAMSDHAADAHEAVVKLWEAVGARVVQMNPEQHDAIVARTSHVPHIAAAALAQLLGEAPDSAAFIGNGFRDTTRLAEGRAELWRDICLTNAGAIDEALKTLIEQLQGVSSSVAKGDADALDAFFEAGREARIKAFDA